MINLFGLRLQTQTLQKAQRSGSVHDFNCFYPFAQKWTGYQSERISGLGSWVSNIGYIGLDIQQAENPVGRISNRLDIQQIKHPVDRIIQYANFQQTGYPVERIFSRPDIQYTKCQPGGIFIRSDFQLVGYPVNQISNIHDIHKTDIQQTVCQVDQLISRPNIQ